MSDEGVSLDCFKLWSITALRSFLHLRRKSNEGSPEELAARCVVGKFSKSHILIYITNLSQMKMTVYYECIAVYKIKYILLCVGPW